MASMNWENIRCPVCHEKRKNTKKNKIFYDPLLSDKKKGKMCFTCTNHKHFIMFVTQVHTVKNVIVSVKQFVFQDRMPST